MTTNFVGEFDTSVFRDLYQRNNKRGGLKNLRCFPSCGETHKERGFCGRHVHVEYRPLMDDDDDDVDQKQQQQHKKIAGANSNSKRQHTFLSWVEFVRSEEPPVLNYGDAVTMAKAQLLQRSKKYPKKPWIIGDMVENHSQKLVAFEYNRDRKGWHYGWASNKHSCDSRHMLQSYLFEVMNYSECSPGTTIVDEKFSSQDGEEEGHDEDTHDGVGTVLTPDTEVLVLRGLSRSPMFMLFCRRRRRFKILPTAPISIPIKSNASSSSLSSKKRGKKSRLDESEEEDDDDDDDDDNDDDEDNDNEEEDEEAVISNKNLVEDDNKNSENLLYEPDNSSKKRTSSSNNLKPTSGKRAKTVLSNKKTIVENTKNPASKRKGTKILAPRKTGGPFVIENIPGRVRTAKAAAIAAAAAAADLHQEMSPFSLNDYDDTSSTNYIKKKKKNYPLIERKRLDAMMKSIAAVVSCVRSNISKATDNKKHSALSTPRDFDIDSFLPSLPQTPVTSSLDLANTSGAVPESPVPPLSKEGFSTTELDSLMEYSDFFAFIEPSTSIATSSSSTSTTNSNPLLDKKAIIDDLAKYLISEKRFTEAIHTMISDEGLNPEDAFLQVMSMNMQGFLDKHKITMDEFDDIFNIKVVEEEWQDDEDMVLVNDEDDDEHTNTENQTIVSSSTGSKTAETTKTITTASQSSLLSQRSKAFDRIKSNAELLEKQAGFFSAFSSIMSSTERKRARSKSSTSGGLGTTIPYPIGYYTSTGIMVPNISGIWRKMEDVADEEMHELRGECGIPWILSKMMNYMESRIEIEQEELNVHFSLQRKLLASGLMTVVLDGEERPWNLEFPLFSDIASSWTYRAWIDDKTIMLQYNMGDDRRITKSWRTSYDGAFLYSTVTLDILSLTSGLFEESKRLNQTASREL